MGTGNKLHGVRLGGGGGGGGKKQEIHTECLIKQTLEYQKGMDHREMGCEARRWMELAQDGVQWRFLYLQC